MMAEATDDLLREQVGTLRHADRNAQRMRPLHSRDREQSKSVTAPARSRSGRGGVACVAACGQPDFADFLLIWPSAECAALRVSRAPIVIGVAIDQLRDITG